MTSTSDPLPLFDLVTGFPPDDAIDVTVPVPRSLAIYMTMLESTGHAAEVATLRRIHRDQARATVRGIETALAAFAGPDLPAGARLKITHIVEERVRGFPGLRPHLHVFVGPTARSPDGARGRIDVDALASWVTTDLLPGHREQLAATTSARCGLRWGADGQMAEPPWLVDRTAQSRDDEPPCPGPWPRRQVVAGRDHTP